MSRPVMAVRAEGSETPASRLLPPAEIRALSQLSPATSVFHLALEWALIVGAGSLAWHIHHVAAYLVAMAFIGGRQHALLLLMHEGAHHRLCVNRRLHDWLGEVIAWPFLFIRMRDYRSHHIPHHRHLHTAADPDWVRKQNADWIFPTTWRALLGLLALDLTGVGLVRLIGAMRRVAGLALPRRADNQDERAMVTARAIFLGVSLVVVIATGLGLPVLLFWVLPLFTWMQLANHLRSIAEHFAIDGRTGLYARSRTTLPTWFDWVFLAPKNIGFHVEHHMYPSVPFYNLPELHRRLMSVPEYRRSVHLSHGYAAVLRECVASGGVRVLASVEGVA